MSAHANCEHAATKSARAACRRKRSKFDDVFASIAAEALSATAESTELEARYDRVIAAADELVAKMEADEIFQSVDVTRENWRDFKETAVTIFTRISDDEEAPHTNAAHITQWGKQWVTFIDIESGKTRRAANSCLGARTVKI